MNDNLIILLFALGITVAAAVSVILMKHGAENENKRLYNKCLIKHSAVPYGDAVAYCEEEVK